MKIYDYHGKKNLCGEKVRQARTKNKMTQEELAAKLQIAEVIMERNSIIRIESGTRFVADFELMALAKILNVTFEWLLEQE